MSEKPVIDLDPSEWHCAPREVSKEWLKWENEPYVPPPPPKPHFLTGLGVIYLGWFLSLLPLVIGEAIHKGLGALFFGIQLILGYFELPFFPWGIWLLIWSAGVIGAFAFFGPVAAIAAGYGLLLLWAYWYRHFLPWVIGLGLCVSSMYTLSTISPELAFLTGVGFLIAALVAIF